MTRGSSGPDLGFVRAWLDRYWLAIWFGIISGIRLSALVGATPGFDGRLYLDATRAWLAGTDPGSTSTRNGSPRHPRASSRWSPWRSSRRDWASS